MAKKVIDTITVDISSGIYNINIFKCDYHPPQSPNPYHCDSDLDCSGYTDLEYEIRSAETDTVIPISTFTAHEIDYIEGRICERILD